jgi:hypothetical protein
MPWRRSAQNHERTQGRAQRAGGLSDTKSSTQIALGRAACSSGARVPIARLRPHMSSDTVGGHVMRLTDAPTLWSPLIYRPAKDPKAGTAPV